MKNTNDINQEWIPVYQAARGAVLEREIDVSDSGGIGEVKKINNGDRGFAFYVLVRMMHYIAYPIGSLLRWWLRTEVDDTHSTLKKEQKNVIFAASHFVELDILLIPSILGFFSKHFPIRFFTFESKFYKTEIAKGNILKRIFYGGWFFDICGGCSYDRKDKNLPYKDKLAKHIHLLKKLGHSLIIFPSGTMEPLGTVSRTLPGTAVLSYYSRRPVVTIRAELSEKITMKSLLSRRVKLVFHVGKPLYPNDLFEESFLEDKNRILESGSKELESANKKIQQAFIS